MWTFTFKKVLHDEVCMWRWNRLIWRIQRTYRDLKGIRVVEIHPGRNLHNLSHGLHFHALFNRRIPIRWVRRIAAKLDFGRIHVTKKPVPLEQALYIGKYLTKDQPGLAKGCRRWGSINWPECNRKNDIRVESPFHRNIEQVQRRLNVSQMSADVIHTIFINTRFNGDFKNWSPPTMFYYGQNAKRFFDEFGNEFKMPEGTVDSERGSMLPRVNQLTREQSMQNIASLWKKIAEYRGRRRQGGLAASEKKI